MSSTIRADSSRRHILALAALLSVLALAACSAPSAPVEPAASMVSTTPRPATGPAIAPTPACRPSMQALTGTTSSPWFGETAAAIFRADLDATRTLLTKAQDINERNSHGETLVLLAVSSPIAEPGQAPVPDHERAEQLQREQRARLAIVAALLAAGADPNLADAGGNTPLLRATASFHTSAHTIALLQALLAGRARIDHQDDRGYTALMQAAKGSSVEVVEFLLSHGADRKPLNCEGHDALAIAVANHHTDVARVLRAATQPRENGNG